MTEADRKAATRNIASATKQSTGCRIGPGLLGASHTAAGLSDRPCLRPRALQELRIGAVRQHDGIEITMIAQMRNDVLQRCLIGLALARIGHAMGLLELVPSQIIGAVPHRMLGWVVRIGGPLIRMKRHSLPRPERSVGWRIDTS